MHLKDIHGIANSEKVDGTAHLGTLFRSICTVGI